MPEGDLYDALELQSDRTEVQLGSGATASGGNAVALGQGTTASASGAIAIGSGVTNGTASSARIGGDALLLGAVSGTVADADINNSELTLEIDEANTNIVIRGKDSAGTVISGTVSYT